MYNYPYNAAKGKVFNQILNTDCTFEEFVNRHANYKPGYNFMWMIDEFYFADAIHFFVINSNQRPGFCFDGY